MKTFRTLLLIIFVLASMGVGAQNLTDTLTILPDGQPHSSTLPFTDKDQPRAITLPYDITSKVSLLEAGAAGYDKLAVNEAIKLDCKNTPLWHRNRIKQFAAYSALGLGTLSLLVEGVAALAASSFNDDGGGGDGLGRGGFIWLGSSVALMSTSIPLLISAKRDREKARCQLLDENYSSNNRDYYNRGLRFEVFTGLTMPWEDVAGSRLPGWTLGLEGRSYLGRSNFDLGFRIAYDQTSYRTPTECVVYTDGNYYVYGGDVERHPALRLSFTSDYNFLPDRRVNPFVGMGFGVSFPISFNLEPRVGLEIRNHHRITIGPHVTLSGKDPNGDGKLTSNMSVTYGYCF